MKTIKFLGKGNNMLLERKFMMRLIASGVFICCSIIGFSQQSQSQNLKVFPQDYPVIHPQFRRWPMPALDNVAETVSPILKLPISKKATGYDIRLSQDPSFAGNQTISENNILGTIYDPHRALNMGTWYWQYRVHDGKWSDPLRFQVTDASNKNFAPPIEKFVAAIPTSHPRVLIDKKDQNLFVEQNKNSADAEVLLKEAASWMNLTPPSESDAKSKIQGNSDDENDKLALLASEKASNKIYNAVDLFCKAYILSGDKKYAQKGILWAMAVSGWDPEGVSILSDFGDARCMVSMALAFDTFNDELSQSQKEILLKAIYARANRIYHQWINNIDAKVLSNHVWQYILHYFFQTAIAVYGETDDARNWLQYAYELFLARAPILGGGDGGWCEGASYFRLDMETLLDIPMIIKQYTGYDFIANKKWYADNPYWMVYSFPPGSSTDGFGDDIEKIYYPGTEYLAYADALSKLTGNRLAAWYADQIELVGKRPNKIEEKVNGVISYANKKEKVEKLKLSDADVLRWFRMRYLNGIKRPAPIDASTLPAAEIFRGSGVMDMHSAITDRQNDIMISMRSSPYGSYGHLLADQNTFNVLVGGDRFFYMSGHKVAMKDPHRLGWYKATQGHNGILIDDKGQPFNVEAYGYLPRFIDGKNVSYAVGDASQAYSSKAEKVQTGLTKFRRHLLFLHPNILLIYDELEADHPAKWSWLIHSPYKIQISDTKNQFYCNSSKASATTSLLADQKLQWALSDTFGIPAVNWVGREDEDGNLIEYKNDQWHLKASTTVKTNKMRFLAVMRINQNGKAEQLPYHFNDKGEIVVDGWVINAELDADKPALLEAYNNEKHISFTSGADQLKIDNKEFTGKTEGSSKLVELINGKYVFSEAADVVPDAVKNIPEKNEK